MKTCLLLLLATAPLSACGLNDFVDRQAEWNAKIGMQGATTRPASGSAVSDDEATRQRIRFGEEVENEEARRAGAAPSLTEGMNCTTTRSFSGSANNGVSSSRTECH